MLIDDYEIPERIINKLLSIIDIIPNDDIISYAKINCLILKGYQLNKKNASIFRQRIKKYLATTKNIDHELFIRLTKYSLNSELISFLSLPVLEKQVKNLFSFLDYEQVVVGLLLDERKEVRQLGICELENEIKEISEDEKLKAKDSFTEEIDSLFQMLAEIIDIKELDLDAGYIDIDSLDNSEETEKLQQQIIKLTVELKGAKEYEKKERKVSRALKEKTEKLQRVENDLRTEKIEHKRIASQLKKVNKQLEKKSEELDAEIKSGIEVALKSHIHDWLQKPVAINKYINDMAEDNKDLLLVAENVLEKQAKKDKHSGNLKTLRGQLEKFTSAHNDIVRARNEALNPIPELYEVECKLRKKIADLQKYLGDEESINLTDIAADIKIEINELTTMQDMEKLANKLTKLSEMEILSGNELRSLYSAYHNKQERMYAQLLVDSPKANAPTSLAWRFKYSIDKKQPFVWILDGHNVLFSLKDVFGYDDKGVPSEDARNKLITAMTNLVTDSPQCEVNIFFDGPVYSQEHAATNVKITYSGGEGEHRADNAILELVEYMNSKPENKIRVLVTDDRDLAKKAKKHKTASMRIAEFASIWTI